MALSFVGADSGTNTNGGNVTFDLSTVSPQVGDIVFIVSAVFGRAGTEGRIGNALSYTEIVDTTNTTRVRVAYKVFATGETGPVIEGSGNIADATVGVWSIFRGQDTSTPIDVTTTTATGSSTNPDPPSITPTSNDCMILAMSGSGVNDTTPGTITSYTTASNATRADDNPMSVALAYRLLSGGAGSGENPAAWSGWSTGAWVSATVAIRPAAAAAGQPTVKRMGGVKYVSGFRFNQGGNLWRKAGELLLPRPSIIRV